LAPGQASDPWRILDVGWLTIITFASTDAYGQLSIAWQDADLQTHGGEFNSFEDTRILGAFAQDPAGWLQRYFRPNPYSTAGYFFGAVFSGGYQGSPLPFVPTTTVTLRLGPESTQQSAIVAAQAQVVSITNRKQFIRSLRQVLNSQADITIPEEILSLGPVELVQQPNKTDVLLEQILTELKQRK
jgi:hypothetical protein